MPIINSTVAMTNHTAVKILSGGVDSHGGGSSFQNVTGREECEADPLPPGSSGGDQVSFIKEKLNSFNCQFQLMSSGKEGGFYFQEVFWILFFKLYKCLL